MINYEVSNYYLGNLEKEVQEMIEESLLLPKLKKERVQDTIDREKKELERLVEKYHAGEIP